MSDIADATVEVSKAHNALRRVEEEAKLSAANYRDHIKGLREALDEAVETLDGLLFEERPDYDRGVMERVSRETGEVVDSRELLPSERQLGLKMGKEG